MIIDCPHETLNDYGYPKYHRNTYDEILRLRRLVVEILDLQKIEADRLEMKMRMKKISLPDIAGRVTGKFQSLPAQYLYGRKLPVMPGGPSGWSKALIW